MFGRRRFRRRPTRKPLVRWVVIHQGPNRQQRRHPPKLAQIPDKVRRKTRAEKRYQWRMQRKARKAAQERVA